MKREEEMLNHEYLYTELKAGFGVRLLSKDTIESIETYSPNPSTRYHMLLSYLHGEVVRLREDNKRYRNQVKRLTHQNDELRQQRFSFIDNLN